MVRIIFMIDDDEDDREIFQEAILSCYPKVELMFAVDGAQALQMLESSSTNPDVIFLDYNMPRVNGIQCLRTLKQTDRTRSIPVIMYTTSRDREQEKVALLLGADHYMTKPTSFTNLCNEIKRLLTLIEDKAKRPGELSD
jgi:CheY-like chemotaxis protein